ncbi:MAG: hypothetical protein FWH28_04280 [Clostridiales bacterium]|nr:hypothetical protein [Clostridiales bacterium]
MSVANAAVTQRREAEGMSDIVLRPQSAIRSILGRVCSANPDGVWGG